MATEVAVATVSTWLGRGAYSTPAGPVKVYLRFTGPAVAPVVKVNVPVVPAKAMVTVDDAAAAKPAPEAAMVMVRAPRVVAADRVRVPVIAVLTAKVVEADKLDDTVP